MPVQPGTIGQVGVPLPPTTLVNEAGFYSKLGGNPATANLVFRGENNGAEYQLTSADQANIAKFATFTNYAAPASQMGGWTFLPGGLLYQYGSINCSGAPQTTITFPKAFTQLYSVGYNLTQPSKDTFTYIFNTSNTNFKIVNASNTSTKMYWTAIGKA